MLRAGALALGCLLLALLLGLARAQRDMREEIGDALDAARMTALLSTLGGQDDAQALAELRRLQPTSSARHLHLELRDAAGQFLIAAPQPPALAAPVAWLVGAHALLFPPPASQAVDWELPRPDGGRWQLRLVASADREQREALSNWAEMFALLLAGSLGMLLLMRWSLRRALAPLQPVLAAIEALEHGELGAMQRLPLPMPVRELDAVTRALKRLAHSLAAAEAARRVLAQQVFSLQEDERARLARELHDEFGQRLTALRADAAWLQRQLQHELALLGVVDGMAEQCRLIHEDTRALLARLRPLGTAQADGAELPTAQLRQMLAALVEGWSGRALEVQLEWRDEPSAATHEVLPAALALALYRISQEALTNVARHAQARAARLRVAFERGADGRATALLWSVEDDGIGLADAAVAAQQGSGLAGMRERLWALGSELVIAVDSARSGTRLAARLPVGGAA
ncbi:histidine kinase [Rivibacter subsaxonicus]|uniref:Two-component system sensor histidine kinase UhpB n=1 Tax=Rivibacter subsaxonicus TaxID=457575 RepID=A0A4Q7W0L9_9BURK|nr:histidine kinase [Rivibacter subsaxonicus]RZU02731.1 two-component system sensor histidine kinase UhpB [Rivibacter subsaxonicus]